MSQRVMVVQEWKYSRKWLEGGKSRCLRMLQT